VLAARTTRAENISAHVVGIDLDCDGVLDLRGHLDEHEGRVAAVRRVEGADAHEAMHAVLAFEQAICPGAGDADRRGLDARLIADRLLEKLHRHAVFLGPEQVHAQEHLRPVLGISATRTGVDADERHVVRVWVVEEQIDLAAADLLLECAQLFLEVRGHRVVRLVLEHRRELSGVAGTLRQRFPRGQVIADSRGFLVERRGVARIVPEIRCGDLLVELDQTEAFSSEVKDAPGARLYGRRRRWRGLQARSFAEYSTMN
jgi:hypothetical protein